MFCESLGLAAQGSVGTEIKPITGISINQDKDKLLPREKGVRSIQLAIKDLGELIKGW